MPKWLKNNFVTVSNQPVKNAPLIRYVSALLDIRARRGQKVHLQYVKGHSGIEGNEGADRLANRGTTKRTLAEREWDMLIKSLGATLGTDEVGRTPARMVDVMFMFAHTVGGAE